MSNQLNAQARDKRDVRIRLSVETVLFFFLLTLIFGIRITNIRYNTLFVDEAIYVGVGDNVLAGVEQNTTTWMYGSYLYPILASFANFLAGDVGLRMLSALLTSLAAVLVFQITVRLFDTIAGLWAMLIFGLTPISINVGQYAVYDALAIPLLALTAFFLVRAGETHGRKEYRLLLLAATSMTVAILAKYLAALYVPALLLLAVIVYRLRGRRMWPLFGIFLSATVALLAAYAAVYWHDLTILFAGEYGVQAGSLWAILASLWGEIGLTTLLAGVGGFWLLRIWSQQPLTQRVSRALGWSLLLLTFVITIFSGPLYHVVSGNEHATWKHTIYTLVFLAPLAGYGIATTIETLRTRQRQYRWLIIVGPILTIIITSIFLNRSLDRNWSFQHSWPNVNNEVSFLRSQNINSQQHILAEGAQIYDYYFDFPTSDRNVWQDTWYMEYNGLQGVAAMDAAIRDGWFDYVVFDDYYTPGLRATLEPVLLSNGYTVGFEESKLLGVSGQVLSRIYVRTK